MKPDKKYMPFNYRKSDKDIEFVPFTSPNPLIGLNPVNFQLQQPNLYPSTNITPEYNRPTSTWILPSQTMIDTNPGSMGYGDPLSANYQINPNKPNTTMNNNQGIDTNPSSMGYGEQLGSKPNPNNPNNLNSQQNKNQSEQYPDLTNSDTLYSYNKNQQNNNMNPNNQSTPTKPNRDPSSLLRGINLGIDEDYDLARCCKDNDIGKILKDIEDDCPGILSLLEAYNIPTPIAKLIIKRIIKITMYNCKK